MNLEDLKAAIDQAVEACEAANVDPARVPVRGVTQPSYPLYHGLTNAGFMWDDSETTAWVALACDGGDGYTTDEAFHADLQSNLEAPTECPACGWTLTDEGCVNVDCFE